MRLSEIVDVKMLSTVVDTYLRLSNSHCPPLLFHHRPRDSEGKDACGSGRSRKDSLV